MLEIFALIVLGVLCGVGIWIVVLLGNLPGNMADAVEHPQADAIRLLGWVGLLTLGIGWFAALVWARIRLPASEPELAQRIAALERRMLEVEA